MSPTIPEGDRAVVVALPRFLLRAGMVVVLEAEKDFFIIKRIAAVLDNQTLRLCGDNNAATSRFCETPVEKSKVVGALLFRVRKRGILGL